jgi:hypothetical protein
MEMPPLLKRIFRRQAEADAPPDESAAAPAAPVAPPAARRPPSAPQPAVTVKLRGIDDARGAIYALILAGTDAARRGAGLKFVAEQDGPAVAGHTQDLFRIATKLPASDRMDYIEAACTRLRTMDPDAGAKFLKMVRALIDADRRYTLPEFTLNILLQSQLGRSAPAPAARLTRQDVIPEMRLLLSLMARAGADAEEVAARNLSRLMHQLTGRPADIAAAADLNINALTAALDRLRGAPGMVRQTFVEAVAECVTLDGKVKPLELELLVAISARLGVPMPPLDFTKLSRMES